MGIEILIIILLTNQRETWHVRKIIVIKFVLDKSDELMWMDFETRMRKTIKDLVLPIIERA